MRYAVRDGGGLVSSFMINVPETEETMGPQVRGDLKLLPSYPRRCIGSTRLKEAAFSDVLQVRCNLRSLLRCKKGVRE